MQVFLETERLLLRRFTEDDVDDLVELDGDPDVMRFITGGLPTPRREIENDVLPAFLAYYEHFVGYGFWAAIEKSTGQFLGWFHFRPPEAAQPGEVELGYRLRRSAWGKGYATEGSRALIQKGFAELGVQRVVASTMVVNIASRRVMENAGLRFVRRFHRPGLTASSVKRKATSNTRCSDQSGSNRQQRKASRRRPRADRQATLPHIDARRRPLPLSSGK